MPSIGFFDEGGQLVTSYDPEGYGFEVNTVERHLENGEQLIGVYGIKDRQKWFTSLGFIVVRKVKGEED
jgi:hypothetical protein